jgi:hypothetical protein
LSIASEKSSIFPPEEKNFPVPVITTDLQEGFAITSSKLVSSGIKWVFEKVFCEAAGDIVMTATPPSSISVETGMTLEWGSLY